MSDPRGITKGTPPPSLEDLEKGKTNLDIIGQLADGEDDNPTRSAAAVALKLAGASYTDIATALHYEDAYRARTAVERSLAASAEPTDVSSLRVVHVRRFERLLRSMWDKAINPNHPDQLAYVRTSAVILDRLAKLSGLDAPTQVTMSVTPEFAEMQRWINAVAEKSGAPLAIEGEILDVEVIEADI